MRIGYGRLISDHCLDALNGGVTFLLDEGALRGRRCIAGHDPTTPVRGTQRCRGFTATLTISGAQHDPSGWSIY
jgi:hypothetical protein